MADAQGKFEIESLDPSLVFRLLLAAPGYQPQLIQKVDPTGGPLTARLKKRDLAKVALKQKLVGQVLDGQGRPVEHAKIDFEGIQTEGGGGSYGAVEGVDPVAVSDAKGEFALTSAKPFASMSVTVQASGWAKGRFDKLTSGRKHELRLTKGHSLTGRLVRDDKPVAFAAVGLAGVDRSIEQSIGNYEVTTDDRGRFVFPNLPAGRAAYIYSLMREAQTNRGVAPLKKINIGADRGASDVGDLVIRPAFRVSGRVVLSDGKPLPPGLRAMLTREDAWDFLPNVDLAPDGSFVFQGVPAESVGLSARVPEYRFSLLNPSLDRLNGFSLMGRVSGNIANLIVLQEPGEFKHDWNRPYSPSDQPRDQPLRSVPPEKLPQPAK